MCSLLFPRCFSLLYHYSNIERNRVVSSNTRLTSRAGARRREGASEQLWAQQKRGSTDSVIEGRGTARDVAIERCRIGRDVAALRSQRFPGQWIVIVGSHGLLLLASPTVARLKMPCRNLL